RKLSTRMFKKCSDLSELQTVDKSELGSSGAPVVPWGTAFAKIGRSFSLPIAGKSDCNITYHRLMFEGFARDRKTEQSQPFQMPEREPPSYRSGFFFCLELLIADARTIKSF